MSHDGDYLETQVHTASPHRLHLMVIDGAIRQALRAEQALFARDYETAHAALNRSRDFVAELLSGLDSRPAPDLIERLKALFLFVHRKLVEADQRRDPQCVADALRILEMHRETWLEAGRRLHAAPVAAGAGAAGAGAGGAEAGRSWMT